MARIIIAFVAILFVSVSASDLPEFLHVCSLSDPNFNDCVTNSVMHIRPYLVEGIPDFNIPSLEPLFLKQVVAADNQGGIKITGNDVKAYGSSDFTVANMNADMQNLVYKFDILLPHLYFTGRYEIDGKVLLLPISGSGDMRGNITGTVASVFFRGTANADAAGVRQFCVTEFTLDVTVAKGNVQFDNLFGGDGVIGDVINNAINANFDLFIREMMPIIQKALADSFLEISNGIVSQFTYDQLFID